MHIVKLSLKIHTLLTHTTLKYCKLGGHYVTFCIRCTWNPAVVTKENYWIKNVKTDRKVAGLISSPEFWSIPEFF